MRGKYFKSQRPWSSWNFRGITISSPKNFIHARRNCKHFAISISTSILFILVTIVLFHGSTFDSALRRTATGEPSKSQTQISRKVSLDIDLHLRHHRQQAQQQQKLQQKDQNPGDSRGTGSDEVAMGAETELENKIPVWNTSSFRFEPIKSNWDAERKAFLSSKRGKSLRPRLGEGSGKSRVMLVSGSRARPCNRGTSNHLLLRSAKSKLDYARLHDMQLFYNLVDPYPGFDGWWNKLPLLRMLMLQHPGTEWFWWVDSDAIFTDMSFEPPFDGEEYKNYNLVMYGDENLVYKERTWTGVNAGVYFIRNCQWSLDLIDAWGSLGPKPIRREAEKIINMHVVGRPVPFDSDDQSCFVYLMLVERERWAERVHLETSYTLSGDWEVLTPKFEKFVQQYHPGLGDHRWPLITHFAGCQPCSNFGKFVFDQCLKGFQRAFIFGDNQTYELYGFMAPSFDHLEFRPVVASLKDIPKETVRGGNYEEEMTGIHYNLPGPRITDWDKQRQLWMKQFPNLRRPQVILATGSRPDECENSEQAYGLLRSMKNKVDYCRLHDIEIFYNMVELDPEMSGDSWTRLPILRTMMLSYPEVEWVWWIDSDAVFTNMEFEVPFKGYKKHNIVLFGDKDLLFKKKSSLGLNTGNFFLRNCQWSLDLLDAWAEMGSLTDSVREKTGNMLSKTLYDFPEGLPADDQSSLVYLFATQPFWLPKVFFEKSFTMSGDWKVLTIRYEEMEEKNRPFVTHFEGCNLCQDKNHLKKFQEPPVQEEECLKQMDRAFHFAENQVLKDYGLKHEDLSTSSLVKLSLHSDQ